MLPTLGDTLLNSRQNRLLQHQVGSTLCVLANGASRW
jgi:hypothetical protein